VTRRCYTRYPLGAVTTSGLLKSLASSATVSSCAMRWCSKHSAVVRGGVTPASSMSWPVVHTTSAGRSARSAPSPAAALGGAQGNQRRTVSAICRLEVIGAAVAPRSYGAPTPRPWPWAMITSRPLYRDSFQLTPFTLSASIRDDGSLRSPKVNLMIRLAGVRWSPSWAPTRVRCVSIFLLTRTDGT
jgi:hypothetical protein